MKGEQVGVLSIFFNLKYEDGLEVLSEEPVWQMKNNHGGHWLLGRVQIEGDNVYIANVVIEADASFFSNGYSLHFFF